MSGAELSELMKTLQSATGVDGGAVFFGPGVDPTHLIMVINAQGERALTRLSSLEAKRLRDWDWLNTRIV